MAEKEYIEREAALKEFEKVCNVCMALVNKPMCGDCSVADTVRKVKSIPAADVRPVARAVWRRYSPFTDTYECSNCGEQVIDQQFRTAYCPNCGARMEE